MPLRERMTRTWAHLQDCLFPELAESVGPLMECHKRVVAVLEMAPVEGFVAQPLRGPGRPPEDRAALARAFVAKATLDLPTTEALIERLQVDATLRRLCGWTFFWQVPESWTFSRAFAEFAASNLAGRRHASLIEDAYQDQLVGHISRDSTAIVAREAPVRREKSLADEPKRRRGRPRKGEVVAKPQRRLERQLEQSLDDMLIELPTVCDIGCKRNAKGHTTSWIGYKLHIDTADGDVPVTAILTSASVHDSQVAIPLATLTATRLTNCHDLMDSAYDAPEIHAKSRKLGHVPIIDAHPRRGGKAAAATEALAKHHANFRTAEMVRYDQRTSAERVNGGLKDNHGGRHLRVRGAPKVFCHLMFGVLVIAAEQLLRLVV